MLISLANTQLAGNFFSEHSARGKIIFAKLVALLLVISRFLGSNPDIPKKIIYGRHKQRNGQHKQA
jgi:hypothetical protein